MENFLTNHFILPTEWMWVSFIAIVVTMLYLDLFVFHKKNEEPCIKSVIRVCIAYVSIALVFGLFVIYERGIETGMLYYTGYLVELSLSMDNIFVISLIFTSLAIPAKYQHRVLFWGILGAVIMRAIMIFIGAALVAKFHWILYVFSVFLIFTGFKILLSKEEESDFKDGKIYKFLQKKFRITPTIENEHFFVKKDHKLYITPLFFALIFIELMDVIFAVDSIPAIFLITQDTFVVYTSNIFAILGLRSMYFMLAAAVNRFAYLQHALAIILIFIGCKIFAPMLGFSVPAAVSLGVTFSLLFLGVVVSLAKIRKA
ncbi:MAG: TerC family protein [Alphaproteobacteria bacterium]|nr:TerC family protein [Alphaproteobacteria bacterium]